MPFCDYVGLVNAGTVKQVSPRLIAKEQVAEERRDARNTRFIDTYMARHRGLTDLRALMKSRLKPGPNLKKNGDGNWLRTLPDGRKVVTLGRSAMLQNLADGIRLGKDRRRQLSLYSDLYEELPVEALDPASNGGVMLPTPASLGDATIGEIQSSLHDMASLSPLVQSLQPIGPPLAVRGCDLEIGSSFLSGDNRFEFQDGFIAKSFQVKDGFGIFASFNFPNKPYLTCVRDQAERGSCTAFATTSATEMLIGRTTATAVNLSEQDMWEHYNLALWGGNLVLVGETGTAKTIVYGIINKGYQIPYESSWDYNPSQSRFIQNGKYVHSCELPYPGAEPCSDTTPQAPILCGLEPDTGDWKCSLEDAGIAGSPHTITAGSDFWSESDRAGSTDTIILHLALNHGVALGFGTTPAFDHLAFHEKSGSTYVDNPYGGYLTFDANDVKKVGEGHEIHVVGFISNEDLHLAIPGAPLAPTKGYFIIKNSWGARWGDGGYGYLPWDYVKSLAYEAVYVSGVQ